MKRLLAALLCAACIVLAGCSVIWPEPDTSGADTESFQVPAAQLREYQNKWCYSRLHQLSLRNLYLFFCWFRYTCILLSLFKNNICIKCIQ